MTRRTTLVLADADEKRVGDFRHGPGREALEAELRAIGSRVSLSTDATVIRALMEIGARSVQERLLETGYAAAAESTREDQVREARRRLRARTSDAG